MDQFVSREQFQDALVVAAACAAGRFVEGSFGTGAGGGGGGGGGAEQKGGDDDGDDGRGRGEEMLVKISACMAVQWMEESQPVLAACCMVSAGCVAEAVTLLVRGNELELAFGLACCYGKGARGGGWEARNR